MAKHKFYESVEGHKILDPRYWPKKLKEYLRLEDEILSREIKQDSTLLDIGSGEGRHLNLLSNKCSKLFGVDSSRNMIELSRYFLKNKQNIFIFYDNIRSIDFPSAYFDCIVCMFNTFGNMDKEIQNILLKKVEKFLKPDGKFILSIYSENAKDTQISFYENIGLIIRDYDNDFIYINQFISERFSKEKIIKIIKENSKLKIREIIQPNEISYILFMEKAIQ